jgi:hypothetical protein
MDIVQAVERFKKQKGFQHDKEAAEFFGESETNFNGKKMRGTIVRKILTSAIAENMDLNWIFYGTESETAEGEMPDDVYKRLYELLDEISKLKDSNQALKEEIRLVREEMQRCSQQVAACCPPQRGAKQEPSGKAGGSRTG